MISTTYPNKVGKYVLLQKPWQHWHQSHIEFWTVKPFKGKNWVCLTATVPNIDFQPPKRQQTKSNGIHHKHERTETVCHTRLKNGLKGAVRHNDTTNCIVYNRNCSFTCLQFSNSPISMAEPTASNIIQSSLLKHKYIKTAFLWHTQPYQIQIILSLLKQVQPHKAAFAKLASVHDTQPTVSNTKVMHTHRRMCVCGFNLQMFPQFDDFQINQNWPNQEAKSSECSMGYFFSKEASKAELFCFENNLVWPKTRKSPGS